MTKLPKFSDAKVLVIGDVMLDRFWHGAATRISPEAPVPIVKVAGVDDRPGGAGNVAINLAALGVETTLSGLVGDDCLLYTSPSPRDLYRSRMPSSA